jgi:hypothetical protein
MGIGALVFAIGHPQPTGPIGMALFIAGVALAGAAAASSGMSGAWLSRPNRNRRLK